MMMQLLIIILLRVIRIYSLLLVVYALLSWFPGAYQSKIGRILTHIVTPLVKPFENLHLQFAGLDFTIWAIIVVLQVITDLLLGMVIS